MPVRARLRKGEEVRFLVWGLLVYLCLLFFLFVWAAVERMRSARERRGRWAHAELQLLEQLTEAHRVAVGANSALPAEELSIGVEPFAALGGDSADALALEVSDLAVLDEAS
jgi:hypothetical protein